MHLQQTKRGSRASGGPQYYFHDLPDFVKHYLRDKGSVRVALVTPYGATKSNYFAVSANHKLDSKMNPVPGKVGHDRIQQGHAGKSIGESIRYWYKLYEGDFERIDLDIDIRDDAFYLTPLRFKYAVNRNKIEIESLLSWTIQLIQFQLKSREAALALNISKENMVRKNCLVRFCSALVMSIRMYQKT